MVVAHSMIYLCTHFMLSCVAYYVCSIVLCLLYDVHAYVHVYDLRYHTLYACFIHVNFNVPDISRIQKYRVSTLKENFFLKDQDYGGGRGHINGIYYTCHQKRKCICYIHNPVGEVMHTLL